MKGYCIQLETAVSAGYYSKPVASRFELLTMANPL